MVDAEEALPHFIMNHAVRAAASEVTSQGWPCLAVVVAISAGRLLSDDPGHYLLPLGRVRAS